ncbi:MAG: HAD family hydrolase [Planctomycetota bacterium]|nr:HAD family hydrolase [Planctomycetota bacterium]
MIARSYDALLLDLDGTLLDSNERILPRNLEALHAAREAGVRVMVVTGRSYMSALDVLNELDLDTRAVLFNGAAVYCPKQDRLIEERTLSGVTLDALYDHADQTGDLTVVMTAGRKIACVPNLEQARSALDGLHGVEFVEALDRSLEYVIRVTFVSDRHADSGVLAAEVEERVGRPLYVTHFPLSVLPRHRESRHHAVDVHPPCAGKAEALRVLRETYGITSERVVAVGDATNDTPMIEAAGLGVAMGSGMRELREVADRVIGHHDEPVIADLIEELFLGR